MEQEKSKKVLIGVLIAIIVLLLVICYLLFGKELLNDNKTDNSTTTTTTTTTTINGSNNISRQVSIIENPATLLTDEELKTNFNAITKNNNGIKINYTCNTYENNRCLSAILFIDDKIYADLDLNTCGTTKLIKSAKYYIVEDGTGCGTDLLRFTIYDLNGVSVYKETAGTTYKNKTYVKNNIYYYNTYKVINEDENQNILYYKSINLSNDSISVIDIKNETITDMPGEIS